MALIVPVLAAVLLVSPGALGASLGSPRVKRIVHGQVAQLDEFPHQVGLERHLNMIFWIWEDPFCGGALLTERWVLTAAHCIHTRFQVYVVAGTTSLRSRARAQTVLADLLIRHDNYAGGVTPFDIGLVRTAKPILLGGSVALAALPTRGVIPQGEATMSGWGDVSNGLFSGTSDLHKMTVPLLDLPACNETLRPLLTKWRLLPLSDVNLCTGPGETNDVSVCVGDSGGPLIQKTRDKVTVVGIASWCFMPCGSEAKPSVYTRVSAFVDWIQDNMAANQP